MSIINRPPEMAKREYELQEPIAVAVEKYLQSTPDHVVNSALKIVIGEMWSSAAGTGPLQTCRAWIFTEDADIDSSL